MIKVSQKNTEDNSVSPQVGLKKSKKAFLPVGKGIVQPQQEAGKEQTQKKRNCSEGFDLHPDAAD